jgi:nucleoid DNA-binding protein
VETSFLLSYPKDMPLVLKDLVRLVAKATRLRNQEARVVVDRMLREIVDALRRGEKIELRGLGTFEPLWVEGRKGRDWKTGETVDLPPMRRVAFRPGRSLRPRKLPEKVFDRKGQALLFELGPVLSDKTGLGWKTNRSRQRGVGGKT